MHDVRNFSLFLFLRFRSLTLAMDVAASDKKSDASASQGVSPTLCSSSVEARRNFFSRSRISSNPLLLGRCCARRVVQSSGKPSVKDYCSNCDKCWYTDVVCVLGAA